MKNKELLFKDLSARLPYHVRCKIWLEDGTTEEGPLDLEHNYADVLLGAFYYKKIKDIKPYLRPMSSMTEEEMDMVEEIMQVDTNHSIIFDFMANGDIAFQKANISVARFGMLIDFLNKRMLDWRGLIPMGLALEAKEGMYN